MRDVSSLVGRISRENIVTLQKYAELVAKRTEHPIIVDVGTLAGMSAIAMALVSPNIRVLTCDPLHNPVLDDQLEEMGVLTQVKFYQMTSTDFAMECPEKIDMCFIDGIHNYDGVKNDVLNIGTRVVPGGYILFHDRNLYPDTIGAAIDEFEGVLYKQIEYASSPGERDGYICVAERLPDIYDNKT